MQSTLCLIASLLLLQSTAPGVGPTSPRDSGDRQAGTLAPPDAVPLPHAHAHNDYRHARPLLDALEHGFTSVEADVFLVGDKLCVAHDRPEIDPERTLRRLYLDPLRARVQVRNGHVYAERSRFLLLVDVKSEAEPTYRRLHETLAEYRDIVTSFEPQGRQDRAVLVIVSGNRSLELMRSQSARYAGYDGRLTDLGSAVSADLVPLISDRWSSHFRWRGDGPIPTAERETLSDVVEQAHAKGRLVRFWATPDEPTPARTALWRQLREAKVDLINTDDLQGLRRFLLQHGR